MEQKQYQGWSIIVDADGCLTDGKKYVDATGQRQMIAFHSRDSIACNALVEMGFRVIIITLSDFEGIANYWTKYGAEVLYGGKVGKLTALRLNIWEDDWEKTIGIGDDVTDICYLEKCKFVFLPSDAASKVQRHFNARLGAFSSETPGGNGMLSYILDDINQGILEDYNYEYHANNN